MSVAEPLVVLIVYKLSPPAAYSVPVRLNASAFRETPVPPIAVPAPVLGLRLNRLLLPKMSAKEIPYRVPSNAAISLMTEGMVPINVVDPVVGTIS